MRQTEKLEVSIHENETVRGVISFDDARTEAPAIIFAHGFGSTREGEKAVALEKECSRRGWMFAACDFRGHGESGGTMLDLRGARLIEDLDAIRTEVAARTEGPVFLTGSSMGGWAVAWLAAREPARVPACAFIAPAFHFLELRFLDKAGRKELQRSGRYRYKNEFLDVEISSALLQEADKYSLESMYTHFRSPVLLLHGMRDELVPYQESVEFAEQCVASEVEVCLIKSGDHRLTNEKHIVARKVCDFFSALL